MKHELVNRWADLLVDYCLGVAPGETILIGAELEARPLVEACYKAVVRRGANPLIRLELPGLTEFFLKNATDAQLQHLPATALYEAETVHGRIRIAAETDTRAMSRVDPRRQAVVDRARDPIRRAARLHRWVITQYPTCSYAADAGMDMDEYDNYVASAMFLDRPDPVAAWQELGRRQAGLVTFMSGVKIDSDRGGRARISRFPSRVERGSTPMDAATCLRGRSSRGRSRKARRGSFVVGFRFAGMAAS